MNDSQPLENATTSIQVPSGAPDAKTRRYDRQLRLWAASGQAALESARLLVIPASATATSVMKNLVLPGLGHFTLMDDKKVTGADAGNNFFLDGMKSIGKSRAEEGVQGLLELNDGVEGVADVRDVKEVLKSHREWLKSFDVVIAHNVDSNVLDDLADLLWPGTHLVVVNSAGFLAEFSIHYQEHQIVESHSETAASLRIDKAFPALLDYAMSLSLETMDITDHAHIPYPVILVRALEEWRREREQVSGPSSGQGAPSTAAEKKAFKERIRSMMRKFDEENFEEAESQAYKCWTTTGIPSEVKELFTLYPASESSSSTFPALVSALFQFAQNNPASPLYTSGLLPLTSTLPDMKSSTDEYVKLQRMYRAQAETEKTVFKQYLSKTQVAVDEATVDTFLKNAHALKVLKGRPWKATNPGPAEVLANKLTSQPRETATHLALAAARSLRVKGVLPALELDSDATKDITMADALDKDRLKDLLTAEVKTFLPPGTALPEEEWDVASGEIARAPSADLPTTAAFLGGLVAQEIIKMITKQYVPISAGNATSDADDQLGVCVVDLVETWTAVI
ncbi:hypothetical protein GYMLUDRAFT_94847 [Collybiopsis luxurians FD-317 M1]|uniref:NEDD8-activating enzyme E1 regulatory subunit n=1 Tax=Collybiopsis luxurians FD-317 M1 TaxID=944289 RepID=A0A0D0BII8_9AGAR|nr:hypothetical protein GYMLUDRAFT_94847 [Collybiopsis luxurians FD-317 M1]